MKKSIRLVALVLVFVCVLFSQVALAGGEYTVVTGGGRLNMRKTATTSATIILYIPNGTPVDDKSARATSVSGWKYIGSWGYLSGEAAGYNHYKNGWVQSKFLQ
ncbi:MAG: hypothetical protein Q4B32_09480 [Clostridia bacterium]|nr:hypothetical protein [Clostridia bacterium]